MLHADGQHLLDGRAEVAADAVAIFTTEQNESSAEILHPSAIKLHLLATECERGEVAEQEEIKLLQVVQRARRTVRPAQFHRDAPGAQGVGERTRFFRVAVHEQHARLAAHTRHGERTVVFNRGVLLRHDLDFVLHEAPVGFQPRCAEFIVADFQLQSALRDEELALIKTHLRARRDVAADVGREVERLAEFQARRHVHALDEHLGFCRIAQRHRPHLDARPREPRCCFQCASARVVAIAQQHDALRLIGGE